ncbi:MAG: undecaprenyl-phosphate glucose phosphotransferase [Hyphomicrobiaceae bacterium]|nr:undecaprenyl-phosphate glucose phosphotransferase [Hyphomicrobiaceae bacterium]
MTDVTHLEGRAAAATRRFVIGPAVLSLLIAATTAGVIVTVSTAGGAFYHWLAYGEAGGLTTFAGVGTAAAILYLLPQIYSNELRAEFWLGRRRRRFRRVFEGWIATFALLVAIGFLTKTTELFSRGWAVMFFVVGLAALLALEIAGHAILRRLQARGRLRPRRLLLVGTADELAASAQEIASARGVEVAAAFEMDKPLSDSDEMERAIAAARQQDIGEVLILSDWAQPDVIRRAIASFSMMPVAIHVRADHVLGRGGGFQLDRVGDFTTINLVKHPLTPMQALAKRMFDVAASATALLLLSPLMLAVAILIKLDSPGPVLFRQRRRGYNHREFAILKFRTMTTMDDGDEVKQAQRNDPRITRIGAHLRRLNIDELPQFWNVLMGDMSVVGPRPHAVAHDRFFESRIATYPRRLNVRPGITGWAQVNGCRGETDTDDKMAKRVEFDLAYIDNWSLGLDVYILFLTVASPLSYRNAR